MNFISYAQNFEDVMLWRALKQVGTGFYIDVGANDPSHLSVTRAFYEAGWRGINIEPVKAYYDLLSAQRPNDVNLCVGAGAAPGKLQLFNIPDTGLATADPAVAERHRSMGWNVIPEEMTVQTLTQICDTHVSGPIHFLKIDVEGAERDVLLGLDLARWRPWIVVVEATVPLSEEQVHHRWEHLLLDAKYDHVYFDGLNRYYLANEHAELKPAFDSPPNPFDQFITREANDAIVKYYATREELDRTQAELTEAKEARLQAERAVAEVEQTAAQRRVELLDQQAKHADALELTKIRHLADLQKYQDETESARAAFELQSTQARRELEQKFADELAYVRGQMAQLDEKIATLLNSSSWRITAPLRKIASLGRATSHPTPPKKKHDQERKSVKSALRSASRKLIKSTLSAAPVRAIITRPGVRGRITSILYHYPTLDAKVRGMVHRSMSDTTTPHMARPAEQVSVGDLELKLMPRSARRALLAMKRSSTTHSN